MAKQRSRHGDAGTDAAGQADGDVAGHGPSAVIRFTLSRPTPSLNSRQGRNWRVVWARGRRIQLGLAREIAAARLQAGAGWAKPIERAELRIIRFGPKELDEDNLSGGVKLLVDVLKPMHPRTNPRGLGLIAGDEPSRLRQVVTQQICAKGQARTEVEIVPMGDGDTSS